MEVNKYKISRLACPDGPTSGFRQSSCSISAPLQRKNGLQTLKKNRVYSTTISRERFFFHDKKLEKYVLVIKYHFLFLVFKDKKNIVFFNAHF